METGCSEGLSHPATVSLNSCIRKGKIKERKEADLRKQSMKGLAKSVRVCCIHRCVALPEPTFSGNMAYQLYPRPKISPSLPCQPAPDQGSMWPQILVHVVRYFTKARLSFCRPAGLDSHFPSESTDANCNAGLTLWDRAMNRAVAGEVPAAIVKATSNSHWNETPSPAKTARRWLKGASVLVVPSDVVTSTCAASAAYTSCKHTSLTRDFNI